MLPDVRGIGLLPSSTIRRRTAGHHGDGASSEVDVVLGLEIGAATTSRTLSPRELIARIRAVFDGHLPTPTRRSLPSATCALTSCDEP